MGWQIHCWELLSISLNKPQCLTVQRDFQAWTFKGLIKECPFEVCDITCDEIMHTLRRHNHGHVPGGVSGCGHGEDAAIAGQRKTHLERTSLLRLKSDQVGREASGDADTWLAEKPPNG